MVDTGEVGGSFDAGEIGALLALAANAARRSVYDGLRGFDSAGGMLDLLLEPCDELVPSCDGGVTILAGCGPLCGLLPEAGVFDAGVRGVARCPRRDLAA